MLTCLSCCGAAMSDLDVRQLERLSGSVSRNQEILLLSFQQPCWYCRQATLELPKVLELATSRPLTPNESISIRRILRSPTSFIFGIAKSCGPFVPEFGLEFQGGSIPSVLLISSSCQTARLIQEPSGRPYFFNIDPSLHDLLSHLHFGPEVPQ
jgi:hypothetical protein